MTRNTLILLATALALSACHQIPDNSMQPTDQVVSPADNLRFERLKREARGAFLTDVRTVADVEDSAGLFAQALQIRTDDYDSLWEAARTCIWLSNYGPEKKQKEYVRRGITYANTAVLLRPEGEEGLFYDGALAGKLAELDISYGPDSLKTVMARMEQLVELGSNYNYGGPERILGIIYMRTPGSPLGPGDWDKAEEHMNLALNTDPNWPENQLYMAELEFGLANKRDLPEFKARARARLQKHFLAQDAQAPMGAKFEFEHWQLDARKLLEDNK